jgi:Flp pilus assembly protein TadG
MRVAIDWLKSGISRLVRERAANVTFTFAMLAVPVVAAVGTAVDYSRANANRTAMQNALDATALTLGKEAADLNTTNLNQRAKSYFNAQFSEAHTKLDTLVSSFDSVTETLTLNATGKVDTTFTKIIGFKKIKIDATSTVTWGTSRTIEVALVLDNTGSMASSGKIEALRAAAKSFIDAMKKASKKRDAIKVAIIPFDTHVNIGPAYNTASWIDWSLMDAAAGGTPSTWSRDASNNYGDADDDTRYDDDRINRASWTGCVIDRAQSNDVLDTSPSTNSATWYPAENCGLIPLLPLTTDWAAAKAMIDKMKADGKTNLTIGLVWGWHALTANSPLPEAAPPSNTLEKIIVFLTDGLNTQNRWTTKAADIDARTRLVCDNIKKAGIKVYTIRVMEGNQSLLQSCASNPGMYYNVTQASQIAPVFEEIARSLQQLRIAR